MQNPTPIHDQPPYQPIPLSPTVEISIRFNIEQSYDELADPQQPDQWRDDIVYALTEALTVSLDPPITPFNVRVTPWVDGRIPREDFDFNIWLSDVLNHTNRNQTTIARYAPDTSPTDKFFKHAALAACKALASTAAIMLSVSPRRSHSHPHSRQQRPIPLLTDDKQS